MTPTLPDKLRRLAELPTQLRDLADVLDDPRNTRGMEFSGWQDYLRLAADTLEAQTREIERLQEALDEGVTAINNLMMPVGHEPLILRKHPAPCNQLDFCVVSDAKRRLAKIEAALATSATERRPYAGE
jgi:hypothetical protein